MTPPLAITLTGGQRNDVTQLIPLIDAIPPIRGVVSKARRRPRRLYADRVYDHDKYSRLVRARSIATAIARRGVEQGSGLAPSTGPWNAPLSDSGASTSCASAPNDEPTCITPSLNLACSIICLCKLILN